MKEQEFITHLADKSADSTRYIFLYGGFSLTANDSMKDGVISKDELWLQIELVRSHPNTSFSIRQRGNR